MNPTAEYLSASPGTIYQCSTSPCEIRVQRQAAEAAFEAFYSQISDVQRRQEQVFESLGDLLPQMLAAMLEAELTFRSRTVTLNILQRLWETIATRQVRVHGNISDISLALWLNEELPRALERTKQLLEDYFEELLQCMRSVEAARSQLFSAFDISVPERHRDLTWIKEAKIFLPGCAPFRWQPPAAWFCFCWVPSLRRSLVCKYEKRVSADVTRYCDHLSELVRQAARDWLSEVKWHADQEFLERTAGWAVSAEIGRLLRLRWRAGSC